MRSRALLHKNKLHDFTVFAIGEGYLVEHTKGAWEVLRLRLPDAAGTNLPLIYYERARGDHLTVMAGEPLALVQRYLIQRGRRR